MFGEQLFWSSGTWSLVVIFVCEENRQKQQTVRLDRCCWSKLPALLGWETGRSACGSGLWPSSCVITAGSFTSLGGFLTCRVAVIPIS